MDRVSGLTHESLKKIFSAKTKLIAACRPGGLSDEERKKMLMDAVFFGAAYVDVEVDASDEYKQEIISAAKKKGCKVIISYHNFSKTPVKEELDQIVNWCFDSGADIAKIACVSNSGRDSARLLGLLDTDRPIIAIGMGVKGRITRVAAPLLGSPFTFASMAKGKEAAPGQLEKSEMQKVLEVLENVQK
jgi:3-dehydroquinate dehydratase type I